MGDSKYKLSRRNTFSSAIISEVQESKLKVIKSSWGSKNKLTFEQK